jgi:hypothetical protein
MPSRSFLDCGFRKGKCDRICSIVQEQITHVSHECKPLVAANSQISRITLTRPGLGLFVRLAHGEAVFVTCRDDQCVLATCAKSW